jgi:hypothetical protein
MALVMASPLGGAYAIVHTKACAVLTQRTKTRENLHQRPGAISSTERQWLSKKSTGCDSRL